MLVDLGATEDWFADILDREEAEAVEVPGLADLLKGKSSFGEIIRRDLSSGLDVVPSGGKVSAEGLDDALRALGEAYETVVLHASDWRSAPARAASEIADATIVVAPAARVRQIFGEAQAGLAATCPKVIPFAAPNPPADYEEAA